MREALLFYQTAGNLARYIAWLKSADEGLSAASDQFWRGA